MTKVVRIKCKLVAKLPFSLFIVTYSSHDTYSRKFIFININMDNIKVSDLRK